MSIRQTEQEQITALYERLSRDDEQLGDSNSIVMQKRMLEDYAAQHGFSNCAHYTDDGYTGGNFERPDWKRLVADIENGKVAAVLVKDMSRVGRDYLQTGFYTEVFFPQHGVRFIAITNGGGIRDSDECILQKVPIWCRFVSQKMDQARIRFSEKDIPVALGGVAIRPGDVIVADGDGVIAVPRCAAEQVAFYASRELRSDKANRRAKYAVLGWTPDETMQEDE